MTKEYKEVRKRLSSEAAAPYMGVARKILGEMKERMEKGGLSQLVQTKDLPDGVRVMVASIFGQDTVSIFVPVAVGAEEQRRLGYHLKQAFCVVGYTNSGGGNKPFQWDSARGLFLLNVLPGDVVGVANNVSDDGSTIVGTSQGSVTSACFWKSGNPEPTSIGQLSGAELGTTGDAVSYDGAVIAGMGTSAVGNTQAFMWTRKTGMIPTGIRGQGRPSLSADGIVLAATEVTGSGATERSEAFIWTERDGKTSLGKLVAGGNSEATGISPDGTVVVGFSGLGNAVPFMWTSKTGMVGLGNSSGSSSDSAYDVSDTRAIVGYGDVGGWRWTEDTGIELIAGTSVANGISQQGDVVVGADSATGAFVWTRSRGVFEIGVTNGQAMKVTNNTLYVDAFGNESQAPPRKKEV